MKKIMLMAAVMLQVVACGSENKESEDIQVSEPVVVEAPQTGSAVFDNVWGPDVKNKPSGPIYVYLNKYSAEDAVAQREHSGKVPPNALIIDAADVANARPKSLRDDLIQDGQVTWADVLLYVSSIRSDFNVTPEWNEELLAYEYLVSFDEDGDGEFDYIDDKDWAANVIVPQGVDAPANTLGETIYSRLEIVPIKYNAGLYFRKTGKDYTEFRNQRFKTEADRKREQQQIYGDNTVVVSSVSISTPEGGTEIFNDVKVTAHNLRPDIFKVDKVITLNDVFMSMQDQGLIDVGFSFWGKLGSETQIQHFIINEVNGEKLSGLNGYLVKWGEDQDASSHGAKYDIPSYLKGKTGSYCDSEGSVSARGGVTGDGLIDEGCEPEINIKDWFYEGENHFFPDTKVINNTVEWVLVKYDFKERLSPEGGIRIAGDGKYPVYDINNAIEPLNESHFGWKVADCGTCHSLKTIHKNGDMGSLGVSSTPVRSNSDVQFYPLKDGEELVVAPYQCAQCHGNNGGLLGHGETSRCFWCHSEDFENKNHGSASSRISMMYAEDYDDIEYLGVTDIPSTDAIAVAEFESKTGYDLSNLAAVEGMNWTNINVPLPGNLMVRTNSDQTTDPAYPDPYSCVTCHPNH
jgi:hypothetical protein